MYRHLYLVWKDRNYETFAKSERNRPEQTRHPWAHSDHACSAEQRAGLRAGVAIIWLRHQNTKL